MGIRPLLTRKEVAQILRIHEQTLWELLKEGLFPIPTRVGRGRGSLRWTEEQVNTYILEKRGEPLDLSIEVRKWSARSG